MKLLPVCGRRSFASFAALTLLAAAALLAGCAAPQPRANEQKVVVLAGASSGIGKGVALALAGQGAHVVLAARRTALLEDLARQCEQRGGRALAVTTDVSREEEVRRLADSAVDRFGRIDVWINLAGVGVLGRFEEVPLADHHRVVDVNLNGVINGSYFALKQFRRQGNGTLINIASVAGRVPFPYYASYAATKHAVIGLGSAINQELRVSGNDGIHVSTVSPFATDTPWFDHAANYSGHKPRMIMLDPPEKVVAVILDTIEKSRPEVTVGYKSKLTAASHRIARRATQHLVGNITRKVMIEDSPPAPDTQGSLYEPMAEGTTIDGRMRERLAEGDLEVRR